MVLQFRILEFPLNQPNHQVKSSAAAQSELAADDQRASLKAAQIQRVWRRWSSVKKATGETTTTLLTLLTDVSWGYGRFHSHGGAPKWLVYFLENPNLKWMMTGGTPISGKPHIAQRVSWSSLFFLHSLPPVDGFF